MPSHQTRIQKTAKMVKRWHGYPARMWELTRSHAALTIVVFNQDPKQNLVIPCIGPRYISGPVTWENSEIEIHVITYEGDECIEIIDRQNKVQIIADTFEVKEHVKLW